MDIIEHFYYRKNTKTGLPHLYKVIELVSKGRGYTVKYVNVEKDDCILSLSNSIFDKQFKKLEGNWGVHYTHCCNRHGCKYGDVDCPVETLKIPGKYRCESCDWEREDSIQRFPSFGFKPLHPEACKILFGGEKAWVLEDAEDFKIKYSDIKDIGGVLMKAIEHVKESLNQEIAEMIAGEDM